MQPVAGVEVSQVVNSPVSPPAFTPPPPVASPTVPSGGTFSYTALASGNPLVNDLVVSGPAGMTIDPNTGVLTWTPTLAGTIPGPCAVASPR